MQEYRRRLSRDDAAFRTGTKEKTMIIPRDDYDFGCGYSGDDEEENYVRFTIGRRALDLRFYDEYGIAEYVYMTPKGGEPCEEDAITYEEAIESGDYLVIDPDTQQAYIGDVEYDWNSYEDYDDNWPQYYRMLFMRVE